MTTKAILQMESLYAKAVNDGRDLFESEVKRVMARYPSILEFCDCQGSTTCTLSNKQVWGSWELCNSDPPKHVKMLFEISDAWDSMFRGSSGVWVKRKGDDLQTI